MSSWRAAVALVAVTAAAAAALFAPPTVSVSSLTLKSLDSVGLVINWTKRCLGTTCPTAWDVVVIAKTPTGFTMVADHRRMNLKDTVRVAKPICWDITKPLFSDTLLVGVRAVARSTVERSNAGTGKLAVRCRRPTAAERIESVAFADSFPKGNTRIVMGDWQFKRKQADRDVLFAEQIRLQRTAKDSADLRKTFADVALMPDSSPTFAHGDTSVVLVLHEVAVCWLGRNKYSGVVVVIDGDPVSCEAPRQRMQAERSG